MAMRVGGMVLNEKKIDNDRLDQPFMKEVYFGPKFGWVLILSREIAFVFRVTGVLNLGSACGIGKIGNNSLRKLCKEIVLFVVNKWLSHQKYYENTFVTHD